METAVAALYVQEGGIYFGLPDVEPWDERRDALTYEGPYPVVAHPPCARWGRMAEVAFGRPTGGRLGDDGGRFQAALASVREWGGVLEHPEASKAFDHFTLGHPQPGTWQRTLCGGWVTEVEQGHYGHRTRKATWLYAVRTCLPKLPAGSSAPEGYVPNASKGEAFTRLSRKQRAATPLAFRDMLLNMARSVGQRKGLGER